MLDQMGGPKVLIVDDDPVIQLLLRVNMEMEGFDVVTAADGEEGLRLASDTLPDIMLLDVMMPKLDGFEVLKQIRIREATRELPVILLSAKATTQDEYAGLTAGANEYMTKPFDPPDLIERVKKLLADS